MESRGTLWLSRPRRLKMDLTGPGGSTLVINGNQMAMHFKALDKTERFDLARDPRAKAIADHLFLLLDADPTGLRQTYDLQVKGTAPLRLELVPKPEALRKIIAGVDIQFDKRGFVDELRMREGNGDITTWIFDDPVINQDIDPAEFQVR